MILMIRLIIFRSAFLAAALVSGCSSQPATSPENLQRAKFQVCDNEGSMALAVGRMYFQNGKRKEAVLKNENIQKSDLAKVFLNELSARTATESMRHYADFAVDKLYACAQREGLNIGKPKEIARVCYARVDIPFYLMVFKGNGMDKSAASEKASRLLSNRTHYPEKLITATADSIYSSSDKQEHYRLMGTVFWSCLYQWQAG